MQDDLLRRAGFGMARAVVAVAAVLTWSACGQHDHDLPTTDSGTTDGVVATDGPSGGPTDALTDAPVDPGVEPAGDSMRFELANPNCTIALFDSGDGCPADDPSCLCKPEFDALNTVQGSPGNPKGNVIVISQPQFGKRADGTYAFDAFSAIKANGNFVGHYVNALNPALSCTAVESWTGVACAGGAGCGWRCETGAARADAIVDAEIATYGSYPAPEAIALNEGLSTIYRDDSSGVQYRTWVRDLMKQMATRHRLPLLYVQERQTAVGPFTLFNEMAQYGLILIEAYVSGRNALAAPGQCAPPYDASNWCYQQYVAIRNAIRNSSSPAIPLSRLIMVEHFATNTFHYVSAQGAALTAAWGRAYDNDPSSSEYGTPSTSSWNTIILRRANVIKALPGLAGTSSYAWADNTSGTGSSYRVQFAATYAAITLP